MVKVREFSENERAAVKYLRNAGNSFSEIARQVGCSKSGAYKIWKNFKKTGSIAKQPRNGRPQKFSERGERAICRVARQLRFATLGEIKSSLSEQFPTENPSKCLVRKTLKKFGLNSYVRKKRPFISKKKQILPDKMDDGIA